MLHQASASSKRSQISKKGAFGLLFYFPIAMHEYYVPQVAH